MDGAKAADPDPKGLDNKVEGSLVLLSSVEESVFVAEDAIGVDDAALGNVVGRV